MAGHTPDGYEIQRDGRVFSVAHNWRGYGRREMIPHPDQDGYLRVRLTQGGKRRKFFVHQLVAAAFLGPRPSPLHQVRHLNGDKRDNRASNLLWGTSKENADDRERHGRTSRGARHAEAIKAGLEARHV